ncbi:DUF2330 domain-containing protein [Gloeocapsa sp. PCC 73106]|uniref:DUF2330 domain-containing protein n=1 Tax=Gloeocapsa sp. PCC 73106 TaxID=102232 RepID=UPI0002ABD7D0|nr:hypothetical protein GLO73106DRAFT_00027230 [Gloeocapsa sp. PCC 73106]
MKLLALVISSILSLTWLIQPVWAFCGFYVAKADSQLYNQASQVIIARDGDRTILTMANDYQGEVQDFAMVVPVPVVLEPEQVRIGEAKILERLDAFSAPRLVEYFDGNPCEVVREFQGVPAPASSAADSAARRESNSLGVTVERSFSVGEYDILILSAQDSSGLETWLRQNGYQIPRGAREVLRPYIRQNLKFFVAKVNLAEYASTGFQSLRPLMIAYESPRFMLPIRLGMLNAQGAQELIIYLLSPLGQVQLTNYRTVKMPSDVELPEFIQQKFNNFYTSMFTRKHSEENQNIAFLEYAWNMSSCDPCAADPLNPEELKQAGVFWLDSKPDVFITRLHLRYTRDKFPEDLQFQATANQDLFQGRYIIRHPYNGEMDCQEASSYRSSVRSRQETEAQTLAQLTGWSVEEIREQIDFFQPEEVETKPWWGF